MQFRKKSYNEQYKKYDWVELDLVKNDSDFRPESYRPYSLDSEISIVEHVDTTNNWAGRKSIVLRNVHKNLSALIAEAHDKTVCTSLAVFKPKRILDFKIEAVEREWDKTKLARLQQLNLFETVSATGKIEVVRKLPYKFSYLFEDESGTESCLMIEDWEIGQLYWNCLAKYEGDEAKACADVRKKYMDDFACTKDLHLFLGTSKLHHYASKNPFMIIGTFQPKIELQGSLF